jgi:hypothetical protein
MNITMSDLRSVRACLPQRKAFGELFGKQARLTRANLVKAARAGLDMSWFACTWTIHLERQASYGKPLQYGLHDRFHELLDRRRHEEEMKVGFDAAWRDYDMLCALALADVLGLK